MKRLFTFVAASIFAVSTFAQMDVWDGSSDVWTKGAGTEASPYQIENAEQLAFISEMVNAGVTTYENTYFKLMTNMDLNNLTWVPIGSSVTNCFKGHLDGSNKTIFNNSVALFGYITDATINRLNVEMEGIVGKKAMQSTITNCQYSGHRAMICQAEQTTIRNCKSHVEINNTDVIHSAGLVDSTYQCQIEDCYVDGSIKTSNNSRISNEDPFSYGTYKNELSTGVFVAISHSSRYIRCLSSCSVSAYGKSEYSGYDTYYNRAKYRYYKNYAGGIIGISHRDSIYYCENIKDITNKWIPDLTTQNDTIDTHPGIFNILARKVEDNGPGDSYIANTFTINDTLYIKNIGNIPPTIINSYSSKDKTEQAMKSASFPIILNAGGNVFMKDISPNVNDGYPIFVDRVYAISDRPNSIDFTKAELAGHFYAQNADSIGFEYKTLGDNTHWYNSVTVEGENSVSYEIENLSVGTEYTYRLWVEREGIRYYGDTINFKTLECSKEVTPLSATICAGEEYSFAGELLTLEGIYYDTLTAVNGCDSIVELTLSVNPTIDIEKKDTISEGESYDFYGEILTETGDYDHYIPMGNKCNRIVLHLYVRQPDVTLSVSVSNPTMGSVEGEGTYEKYTECIIKALPNIGYHFVRWSDNNTDNPRTIVLTQDTSLTAEFAINTYLLSVTCNAEQGTIEGNNGEFDYGTSHIFIAVANEGYRFDKWSDYELSNPRTIVLTQDTTIMALFIQTFIVRFFGFNEELLDQQTIDKGGNAISPEAPVIEHYNFVGWDKDFTNIQSNIDIYAQYEPNSEGIEDIHIDSSIPHKIIIDGQVYILRGDKIYTLQAQEVK